MSGGSRQEQQPSAADKAKKALRKKLPWIALAVAALLVVLAAVSEVDVSIVTRERVEAGMHVLIVSVRNESPAFVTSTKLYIAIAESDVAINIPDVEYTQVIDREELKSLGLDIAGVDVYEFELGPLMPSWLGGKSSVEIEFDFYGAETGTVDIVKIIAVAEGLVSSDFEEKSGLMFGPGMYR